MSGLSFNFSDLLTNPNPSPTGLNMNLGNITQPVPTAGSNGLNLNFSNLVQRNQAPTLPLATLDMDVGSGGVMNFLKQNGNGIATGLNAFSGLLGGYLGAKQLSLAKDQFNFSKDAFNRQYAAQRQMINSQLEDRQRRRVAERPWDAESVSAYMAKYGVK